MPNSGLREKIEPVYDESEGRIKMVDSEQERRQRYSHDFQPIDNRGADGIAPDVDSRPAAV